MKLSLLVLLACLLNGMHACGIAIGKAMGKLARNKPKGPVPSSGMLARSLGPADRFEWDDFVTELVQRIDRAVPELGLLENDSRQIGPHGSLPKDVLEEKLPWEV